jgi:hypothetical protein
MSLEQLQEKEKQRLIMEKLEEDRKLQEELERQREAEEKRQRDLEAAAMEAARAAMIGGRDGLSEDGDGQQETVGCHQGAERGRYRSGLMIDHKKTHHGAAVSHALPFTMGGTIDEISNADPMQGGVWVDADYEDVTRTHNPFSCWRRAYDPNGVMKDFMMGEGRRGLSSLHHHRREKLHGGQIRDQEVRSKLVPQGTMLKEICNDSPFTLGLFLINMKVSRPAEDVLFSKRIASVTDAFYAAHASRRARGTSAEEGGGGGGGGPMAGSNLRFGEKSSTISLAAIVRPNSHMAFDDHFIYRSTDVSPSDLSADVLNKKNQIHQAWVGVSIEDLRSDVLNENPKGDLDLNNVLSYIKLDSKLSRFIYNNYRIILAQLGENPNQTPTVDNWKLPAKKVFPDHEVSLMDPERRSEIVEFQPMTFRYVKMALSLAERMINGLPFERLDEHQFYVARLDGSSWDDSNGKMVDREKFDAYRDKKIRVEVKTEVWFEICTEATSSDPAEGGGSSQHRS